MEIGSAKSHVSRGFISSSSEEKYAAWMIRDMLGWLVPSFLRFGSSTTAPQTGSQISSLYSSRVASASVLYEKYVPGARARLGTLTNLQQSLVWISDYSMGKNKSRWEFE